MDLVSFLLFLSGRRNAPLVIEAQEMCIVADIICENACVSEANRPMTHSVQRGCSMADFYIGIRKGAIARLTIPQSVHRGTLTISGTPKINISDAQKNLLGSYTNISLTIYTLTAQSRVLATYILDTSNAAFIEGRKYYLEFSIPVIWSGDGQTTDALVTVEVTITERRQ